MAQPMMPHPGLARSWASASPFGGAAQPFGAPPQQPQQTFGGAPPPPGMMVPPPPTTFSAAAAAAAVCPSLNSNLQPSPPYHHQQPQQYGERSPPIQLAPPSSFDSLPAGPQVTPPHQPWCAARAAQMHNLEFPGPEQHSDYSGINALLGSLHKERVCAGARLRWEEDPADEDEDEDL